MLHSVEDQVDAASVHALYDRLLDSVAAKLPDVPRSPPLGPRLGACVHHVLALARPRCSSSTCSGVAALLPRASGVRAFVPTECRSASPLPVGRYALIGTIAGRLRSAARALDSGMSGHRVTAQRGCRCVARSGPPCGADAWSPTPAGWMTGRTEQSPCRFHALQPVVLRLRLRGAPHCAASRHLARGSS